MEQLVADGVRVVDVRTEGEYAAGRIPGSENVPVAQIEVASSTWDKEEPIAIYCATGSRSASVVDYLAEQGFSTIYHLDAGIVTWAGEVESGAAAAVPTEQPTEDPAAAEESSEIPVMYEFYTDT
jgi:rhodanese-related sulfurtransferase